MKKIQILLLDKVTLKVEKVENFQPTGNKDLKEKLYTLQLQYCEDEKPEVFEKTVTSDGDKYKIMIAESDSDYCYMTALGKISGKWIVLNTNWKKYISNIENGKASITADKTKAHVFTDLKKAMEYRFTSSWAVIEL